MTTDRRIHTIAVVEAIEGPWWEVEYGERTKPPPVVFVTRIDVLEEGMLDDPQQDFDGTYQFTCVHTGWEGVETLETEVLDRFMSVEVPGRRVLRRRRVGGQGATPSTSDNLEPWFSTPRVRLVTVPS